MKKFLILILVLFVFVASTFAQKLTKKTRVLLSFWRSCEIAFSANDTTAIKNLVKFPVRMNLLGSEYGDNPNLNLTQFLKEEKNLKLYNFRKYFPSENNDLKNYKMFVGYKFTNDCKYYEVQMTRMETKNTGFTTNLFFEERKGVFKIFTIGIEDPINNYGN